MNPVVKKKVFWIQVQAESPLSLSSGKGEETDSDVMRNYDGAPFVPAASLAGAMRAYLNKKKDEPCMMEYSGYHADGKMSALFLSDMNFKQDPTVSVRDGVKLTEKKTAVNKSKYDMEIIEAGICASFYAEITIWEFDREEEYDKELAAVIKGFHNGEIRLGRKKTRGYGRFSVCYVACKEFDKDNYLEYADVYTDQEMWKTKENELDKWLAYSEKETQYLTLEVPLQLKGGISIRQYASKKDEPDFVQLVNKDDKAVIPGSSFAGAIRHRIETILTGLVRQGLDIRVSDVIHGMFGYVEGENAHVSAVIVDESVIEGARWLIMTRTGISRFESSARDKALYTEKTYVDGKLTLRILIKKDDRGSHQEMLGLVLLAVEDLRNGFLAVGGATSIGRGILTANGSILLDGEELGNVCEKIGEMLQPLARGKNA